MGNLLITKTAPYQFFLANCLFRKKIITHVLVEAGSSHFSEKKLWIRNLKNKSRLFLIGRTLIHNPLNLIAYVKLFIRKKKYFGNTEKHNHKILKNDYLSFAPGLKVIKTSDVNHPRWRRLYKIKRDLIIVFGTRLIKSECFAKTRALWINLHWGWSPDYRVEGIISALANEGTSALGVTVHLISEVPDGGHILGRRKIKPKKTDNFYSLGLKLTKVGLILISKIAKTPRSKIERTAQPQNLNKGQATPVSHLVQNPDLFHVAWKNLKNGTSA